MKQLMKLTRRVMLGRIAIGLSLLPPAARATDSELPLLREGDAEANGVHYVEDAGRSKQASSGANCGNCSLYSSTTDSRGSCTLFKDRLVAAAGWCDSWSGL